MPSDPSSSSAWEPPSLEELHELLPQYEITALLGRGGMGAVYKGRQTKLNRDVAIKLLPETFTQHDDEMNFAKRFEQEAQAMAGLNHPAIIGVYDFGETANGQLYFVMEFVDGVDIHQYLKQFGGKLPQEHALAITAHVLDALDYAHRNGIIHRDIKPANILLDSEGRVKIADFGLAKRTEAGGDGPGLTMSNVALGTPDFVAPESLDPEKTPDHRADLYAVGVMLYQMLTGTIPRGKFKLPSSLIPEIDPRVDGIVERTLEPDPDDRYGSASEVRSALDPIFSSPITKVKGGSSEEQAAPIAVGTADVIESAKAKSKFPLLISLGFAAVLLVGGLIWMVSGGGGEQAEAPVLSDNATEEPLLKTEPNSEPVLPPTAQDSEPKRAERLPAVASSKPDTATAPEVLAAIEPVAEPDPKMQAKVKEKARAEEKAKDEVSTSSAMEKTAEPEGQPEPNLETEATEQATETSDDANEPKIDYASVPNLEVRLNRYHSARASQMSTLAASYLRALEGNLNQAADAGNLPLAQAFREEKAHVEALRASLAEKPRTPVEGLERSSALPALQNEAPAELASLRQTWVSERAKIEGGLDEQLQQSLTLLEQELTRSRDFDHAQVVLALRESLSTPVANKVSKVVENTAVGRPGADSESADMPADSQTENPFGWKEIDRDPFPLSRPARPDVPCHLVVWRMDGEAVEADKFKATYGFLPHEMGEVVDFDSGPTHDRGRAIAFLTSEGDVIYTEFTSDTPVGVRRVEGLEIVRIDVSQITVAMLDHSGKPHFRFLDMGLKRANDLNFSDAESWNDLVSVDVGFNHVVGLQRDGKPLSAGGNLRGQLDFPESLREDLVFLRAFGEATWAISLSRRKYTGMRFGQVKNSLEAQHGERFFIDTQFYLATDDGELRIGGGNPDMSTFHGNAPRGLSDIRDMATLSFPTVPDAGIVAARTGQSTWYFWGKREAEDLEFDPELMQEKAEGTFKLLFDGDYVLALKPVGTLDADDWTGEGSDSSASTDSSEATPLDVTFPLPVPKRPELAGRLEIHRLDALPVGSQENDNNLANLPDDLRNNVVSIDAGWRAVGDKDLHVMVAALLDDGTVRIWESSGIHVEKIAANPTLGLTDVVQAKAGENAVIFLKSDGTANPLRPWAFGGKGAEGMRKEIPSSKE